MDCTTGLYTNLRDNADARLVHDPSIDITPLSAGALLHELERQQIELEMSSIEFRQSKAALNEPYECIAITDISESKKLEQTQKVLIRSLKLLSESSMLLIHATNER